MEHGFCERVDLDLKIDLPADAPRGHPHLLEVKAHKSKQTKLPDDLSLVDVLATILLKWKPSALHHLLNIENEEFYCDFLWEEGSWEAVSSKPRGFIYIHRLGEYVRAAIVGTDSDGEISYRICNDGKWEIKSAQFRYPDMEHYFWIPTNSAHLIICEYVERKMAQAIGQRFLVEHLLEDVPFPIWNYEPEGTKKKLGGRRSKEILKVSGLESRAVNTRADSSATLVNDDMNARLTRLEAQVSIFQNSIEKSTPASRKRHRED